MFERRLAWFIIGMIVMALLVVARLVEIQAVRADEYERISDRLLTRPVIDLRAPRGGIYDRLGRPLVTDEPSYDICAHYAMLSAICGEAFSPDAEAYLQAQARNMLRAGLYPRGTPRARIVDELKKEVVEALPRLQRLIGVSPDEIRDQARLVLSRVQRMREAILRRSEGRVDQIAEEETLHPIIEGLTVEQAVAARMELEKSGWLRVEPSARRVAHDAKPLSHLLGRVGVADPRRIAGDPLAADEALRLRPGDNCGVSGVEYLAETTLRGSRGRIIEDYDRSVIERIEPTAGHDVRLTIDAELQTNVYSILSKAVEESDLPAGGSAVVIDVASREIRALVSYPSYDYDDFNKRYDELRKDTHWEPLRFRAVSGQYPPGSTCKVIALYGGLDTGVITPTTTFDCEGRLLPNEPNKFRCWIYNQYHTTHGPLSAEGAIKNSCNIFFFHVGERLGAGRLCEYFSRLGLGQSQETGLIEETLGIVPTEDWLRRVQDRAYQPADAWNFAIGQGEVTATPLQCANVAATVASGHWAPVRLARDDRGEPLGGEYNSGPALNDAWLRVIRSGMWRVVNERGGTAASAQLDNTNHVLCGKTGSAQTSPRVISRRYTLEWPDGHREDVIAPSREDALASHRGEKVRVAGSHVYERFPPWSPEDKLPSHAWFIGFTQSKSTPIGDTPRGSVYAISVLIEFGASGGHVAAPVAKEIAEAALSNEQELGAAWPK